VRDELEPRKSETGDAGRAERLEGGGESVEHLWLQRVERRVGRRQLKQPIAKEAQVRALVEGRRRRSAGRRLVMVGT